MNLFLIIKYFSELSPPTASSHDTITKNLLVFQYATVASMATSNLGAKKKPIHQNSPPKGTLENSNVRRGKIVMNTRKNTPCISQ